MIFRFDTQEKVEKIFELVLPKNWPKEEASYFLVYSQWYPSLFGLVDTKKEAAVSVDQGRGGYLVRLASSGMWLYPLVRREIRGGFSSPSNMRLGSSSPVFLETAQIRSIKIRPAVGVSLFKKKIILEMESGMKYFWLVNPSEKQLPYHHQGYEQFCRFAHELGFGSMF